MKLTFAGITNVPNCMMLNYSCSRDPKCQPDYLVYMPDFATHSFFLDMDALEKLYREQAPDPTFVIDNSTVTVLGTWMDLAGNSNSVVVNRAIFARDWNDRAYGVITELQLTIDTVLVSCFRFVITVNVNGTDFNFYSEMINTEDPCVEIFFHNRTLLEACYPNPSDNEEARDPNDVYYGYTSDIAGANGDVTLRYKHQTALRWVEIYGTKASFKIQYHNSLRAFRATSHLEKIFNTELVPEFMMRELMAIMFRGNFTVDDAVIKKEYRVAEDTDWNITDDGHKMYKCITNLIEQKTTAFNCSGDCGLPVNNEPCPQITGILTVEETAPGEFTITYTMDENLPQGDSIYFIFDKRLDEGAGLLSLASGTFLCDTPGGCNVATIVVNDVDYPEMGDVDLDNECYIVSIERICGGITPVSSATDYSHSVGSNCDNLTVQNKTSGDSVSLLNIAAPDLGNVNAGSTKAGYHLDLVAREVHFNVAKEDEFTPCCATLSVDGVVTSQITYYGSGIITFPDLITASVSQEVLIVLDNGSCHSPNLIVRNQTPGIDVTNVIGVPDFIFDVAHPVESGDPDFTHLHGSGNMILRITVNGTPTPNPAGLILTINGIFMECLDMTGTGDYIFAAVDVISTDEILVSCGFSACP